MTVEIKVPVLPESVSDATIATWHKKVGEDIKRDETLVDIETDKVVLEVVAPADGSLESIIKDTGATVLAEEVIAAFSAHEIASAAPAPDAVAPATAAPAATAPVAQAPAPSSAPADANTTLSPAVRRAASEKDIDTSAITGSGKDNRITKQDLSTPTTAAPSAAASDVLMPAPVVGERIEKRVPMTRLRAKIAERLLEAQHSAAILTTFNEIDMAPVISMRTKYKEDFEKKYGVRLGFMSFFVTAAVEALKKFPSVNASIDGKELVYHGYYDVGIAVSTERGLVVPVVRNADQLSMDQIESQIRQYGASAREGKLALEDMTGGTFTITNGGVFGSLMATPIINPPQSAILGMHKIMERPVVVDKQIVIRPMMYVALSYDHRIIDGAESVKFLVTIKEMLEDPARLLLSV